MAIRPYLEVFVNKNKGTVHAHLCRLGGAKKGTAEPLPRPAPSLLAMSVDGENVIISPKHHQ